MASGAKEEFVSWLGDRLKNLVSDLGAVQEDMAAWARLDAEVRSRRNQLAKITNETQAATADHAANQAELRAALAAIATRVKGAIQKLGKEYLIAIINEWNRNNLPEQLAACIKVYQEVLSLVRRYKNRVPPETDLWALVEEALVDPVAASPAQWLANDDLFKPFQGDARAESAVQTLESELRNLFRINLLDAEPGLFERNADISVRLNGELGDLASQADEAKGRVVEALANIADVIARLAELRDDLKPEEIRDAVRRFLVAPLKSLPAKCYAAEDVPENLKNLRPYVKFDAESMGGEVERRIMEQLRESMPDVFSASEQPSSHPCGAPCRTQKGSCHRQTTDDYCYQHGEAPGAEAQALAGKWHMTGSQAHVDHSGWEAELVLDKSGAARWRQTRGANAGAKRIGRWQWANGVFHLVYRAPKTGRVEWDASVSSSRATSMSGEYRTPQVTTVGLGWGGSWSASKIPA